MYEGRLGPEPEESILPDAVIGAHQDVTAAQRQERSYTDNGTYVPDIRTIPAADKLVEARIDSIYRDFHAGWVDHQMERMWASGADSAGAAVFWVTYVEAMRQAVAGQPLQRPWIGILYLPIDRNLANERDLPIDYGILIAASGSGDPIIDGSPAQRAGLQGGDIITAINGRRVDASNGLDDVLSQYEPGDELSLMVLRQGEAMIMQLTLGVRPAELP